MKRAAVRVGVGTRFIYDGEIVEVVEMHPVGGVPEVVARDLRTESVRRFALNELMFSDRARLLSEDHVIEVDDAAGDIASVKWSAVPESARSQARERAAHVRELLTGYRSGCAQIALAGEPRPSYRMALPKQARMAAKAHELGIGLRTVERWVSRYEAEGEVGLITRHGRGFPRGTPCAPMLSLKRWRSMYERAMSARGEIRVFSACATADCLQGRSERSFRR